jgi:sigma-70-like protein
MTSLAKQAVTETYEEVKNLIYSIVRKFSHSHGGNFEELLSEAHEHFMTAYAKYDRDRAAFTTYLHFLTTNLMKTTATRIANGKDRLVTESDIDLSAVLGQNDPDSLGNPLDLLPDHRTSTFNLNDFLKGLSRDAKAMVKAAIEGPREIILAAWQGAGKQGPENMKNMRRALVEYFEDEGWDEERIEVAFGEVQKAMQVPRYRFFTRAEEPRLFFTEPEARKCERKWNRRHKDQRGWVEELVCGEWTRIDNEELSCIEFARELEQHKIRPLDRLVETIHRELLLGSQRRKTITA